MSAAALEVQTAIYAALANCEPLTALVSGVYDDVPEGETFPYVVIGEETESNRPSTLLTDGRENTVAIHIWSRARGFSEAKTIADAIITKLNNLPLPLQTWKWEGTQYTFSDYMRDPDGITRHGILRFRVRSRKD